MPTRFEHQGTAQVVGIPADPLALLEHRLATRRRESVNDQAQRFAGRVRINGLHSNHRVIWSFWSFGHCIEIVNSNDQMTR
jgi:hypothetical protein